LGHFNILRAGQLRRPAEPARQVDPCCLNATQGENQRPCSYKVIEQASNRLHIDLFYTLDRTDASELLER